MEKHRFIRFWTQALYREFDDICYQYRLQLRQPLIEIVDLNKNWGQWNPELRVISLAQKLISEYTWDTVIEILKHEMAHQIVNEMWGIELNDHGEFFRKAADKVGLSQWGRRASGDLHKEKNGQTKGSRVADLVGKLLKLAKSENENEASLALKKAQDLINTHGISENPEEEFTYHIINHHQKRIPSYQSAIASILMEHFSVEVITGHLYHSKNNCDYRILEILGGEEQVEIAHYIYDYLYNNLPILWEHYRKQHKRQGKAKMTYYLGVLAGLRSKLRQEAHQETKITKKSSSEQKALVMAKEQWLTRYKEKLEHYRNFRHPRLQTRSYSTGDRNSETYSAGYQDGSQLHLNRGIKETKFEPQKLINQPR